MRMNKFPPFGQISALTLGGAGIAGYWGESSEDEAVATIQMAIEEGINHIDVAPLYGRGAAELRLGIALNRSEVRLASPGESLPARVYVTTKYAAGTLQPEQIYPKMRASLQRSLDSMGLEKVSLLLLHSSLVEDENVSLQVRDEHRKRIVTPLPLYFDAVIPAFEKLQQQGLIDHWGITGSGQISALKSAISSSGSRPAAVQCVVNAMHSVGGLNFVGDPFDPRDLQHFCTAQGVPILGIRAVQAGALCDTLDRGSKLALDDPDYLDYLRAGAFRSLAASWGQPAAVLAHRYALSVKAVSSVILGVKNRRELQECLQAEAAEQLTALEMAQIENSLA